MLVPYVRPQDTITQILQQTPARDVSRRNPVVIGPEFKLLLNDGRNLDSTKQVFAAAGAIVDYLDTNGLALDLDKYSPVESSASLVGEDLQALVATFGNDVLREDATDTSLRSIRTASGDLLAGVGTLHPDLDGRQVRIGDYLSIVSTTDGNVTTVRRKVIGLLGKITPGPAPSAFVKSNGPTNANTAGTETIEIVPAYTTAGIVASVAANSQTLDPDIAVFQENGKVVTNVAGTGRLLGDVLSISVVTGGASNAATVRVTSQATGLTADIATAQGAVNTNEFLIDLTDVGYPGSSITLDETGDDILAVGNTARVNLFPTFTPTATALAVLGGDYTGAVDRRYVLEVTGVTGGSTVDIKVYDTSGVEPTQSYSNVIASAKDFGTAGITLTLGAGVYYKGQIFYADAVADAVSTTAWDGVRVDGPIINLNDWALSGGVTNLDSVEVFQAFTGTLDSDNVNGGDPACAMAAEDWSYTAALGLPNSATGRSGSDFSPFADGYGKVFLSYKALRKPSSLEGVIELSSASEIRTKLGETSLENWLSRGALEAFSGNQDRVVYALRTAGDTVADFETALKKIKQTDNFYALVPMTDDLEVMKAVRDHCELMSNKFNKNFRRAYVGTDSPGSYVHWGAKTGGGYRQATLVATVLTIDEGDRAISKFSEDDVGSTITIIGIGGTYEILEVLTESEAILDVDPGITVNPASGITLTRPDTPEATALYVQGRSEELSSRRIANVWSDNPTIVENGVTKVVPCKFLAAEVAGLRCALLPQQGLTLTEIQSVTAAPGMYARFTPELLDDVAAYGTFVVTQESEGGDVFIRHQLTTETEEGALAYEDNVGVIVDEFSYAVKDTFRGYIGRRNATPDTIEEIDDKLQALAADFARVDLADRIIGPAILTFFDEKGNEGEVTVRQDGDLADTLMTYVKLRVPLPLNGINHYIDVEVSELLASEDN
jgi:hypothetical protein